MARRRAMGVVTSSQGDTSQASTTRNVLGGDQPLNPSIGGGTVSPAPMPAVVQAAAQMGQRAVQTARRQGASPKAILGLSAIYPTANYLARMQAS